MGTLGINHDQLEAPTWLSHSINTGETKQKQMTTTKRGSKVRRGFLEYQTDSHYQIWSEACFRIDRRHFNYHCCFAWTYFICAYTQNLKGRIESSGGPVAHTPWLMFMNNERNYWALTQKIMACYHKSWHSKTPSYLGLLKKIFI